MTSARSSTSYKTPAAQQLHEAIRNYIYTSSGDDRTQKLQAAIQEIPEEVFLEKNDKGQTQLFHALEIAYNKSRKLQDREDQARVRRAWLVVLNLMIDTCGDNEYYQAINFLLFDKENYELLITKLKNEVEELVANGQPQYLSSYPDLVENLRERYKEAVQANTGYESDDEADSEAEADEEQEEQEEQEEEAVAKNPAKYKSRLIVGDANFSYTRALLEKHRNAHSGLAKAVVATEYDNEDNLSRIHHHSEEDSKFNNFTCNKQAIGNMGAELVFGVDGTNLTNEFGERRFKRIHFNFPYVRVTDEHRQKAAAKYPKDRDKCSKETIKLMHADTRALVAGFFKSASEHQEAKDRIHMALPVCPDNEGREAWYQADAYDIINASKNAGYKLMAKRKFLDGSEGSARYPGYVHVKTSSSDSTPTAEHGREYIFEKKQPGDVQGSPIKNVPDKYNKSVNHQMLNLNTDSESSSYEDRSSSDDEHVVAQGKR